MLLFIIYVLFLILFGAYLLSIFFLSFGLNKLKRKNPPENFPFLSVIVSAHNEEKNIGTCLEHLSAQNYPKDKIEFIIVDDRSTDDTLKIINSFKERDKRFHSLAIDDRIPEFAPKKRAIDAAIQSARGSIILHTDADGRPGTDWALHMVSCFDDHTHMVLGYAPYTIHHSGSAPEKLLALEYLSHAAVAAATTGLGYPLTCVGTNLAYRKRLYNEIGGFGKFKPFISGDDDLFLTRVRGNKKYGIGYAVAHQAQVFNNPPATFSKFFHQRIRYASKGFYYQPGVIAVLSGYYILNVFLLAGPVLALTGLVSGPLFWASLLIKIAAESFFMRKAAHLLGDRRSTGLLIPASLIHIPYVVLFGVIGQFKLFKWAEDHVENAIQQYVSQ